MKFLLSSSESEAVCRPTLTRETLSYYSCLRNFLVVGFAFDFDFPYFPQPALSPSSLHFFCFLSSSVLLVEISETCGDFL